MTIMIADIQVIEASPHDIYGPSIFNKFVRKVYLFVSE